MGALCRRCHIAVIFEEFRVRFDETVKTFADTHQMPPSEARNILARSMMGESYPAHHEADCPGLQ